MAPLAPTIIVDDEYQIFKAWLETDLNSIAAECSGYVQFAQESPPEKMAEKYKAFSLAWDACEIIIYANEKYRKPRALENFLVSEPVGSSEELYVKFLDYVKVQPGVSRYWVNTVKRQLRNMKVSVHEVTALDLNVID